jgi:thioredoxin 1
MNLLKLFQGGQAAGVTEQHGNDHVSEDVHPEMLDAQAFDKLLAESGGPVVVDFWAEWCGPCHMLAPSVAQLAREFAGRAVVGKLDADENPEILERYGIMGIPTLIYFQGGREVDRVLGVTGYGTLKGKLEKLLAA